MKSVYTSIVKWKQAGWQVPAILLAAGLLAFSANALRPDALPLIGDWSIDARMSTVTGERLDISLQEAEKLFREQAVVFLDARSADEYAKGHIRGSLSLPWQDVDQLFMEVIEDLLIYNLARGLDIHCGCFSTEPSEDPLSIWTIARDAIFLAPAVYLLFANRIPEPALERNDLRDECNQTRT
jgi:rhodanese-related sulfurtransferase